MMDDDDEFLDTLYAIENAAQGVKSGEDFINFLGLLEKEILKDTEVDKRI